MSADPPHGALHRAGLRVAIVGLGPKGLFALERLLHEARCIEQRAWLDIDIFEPCPAPGAGPVYDPAQPEHLRMNFAADQVDMWRPGSRAAPREEQLGFLDWRCADRPERSEQERYPPRADVGRYLADGFARLCREVRPRVTITTRHLEVRSAHKRGAAWQLIAADRSTFDYDEILVTVGHGLQGSECPASDWTHAVPLIPAVYPVTRWLSDAMVPADATIAIRGFGLTFLDAAISLTEGRGGVFEADDHPYRLRYSKSPRDVGRVLPFSRTGRPMLAKPDPQLAASITGLDAITQSGCAQVGALPDSLGLATDLLAVLSSTAAASLLAAGGHSSRGVHWGETNAAARHWLVAAHDGLGHSARLDPASEVERSLAVGAGLRPPGLSWALGHTWRSLYPAIITRLSGDGLPALEWPAFRRLNAELERLSFGPPPVNAAKLLALIAARRVDLDHVAGARIVSGHGITSMLTENRSQAVDAVINAVLPAPGVWTSDGGLLAQLVADGYARIAAGRRGLDVTSDGNCVGRDGHPSPGLSAMGRATEGSVIGNDTLSRVLHLHPDRWAAKVATRLLCEGESHETGRVALGAAT